MALNVKVKRTIDSVFNEHKKGVSRILNEKHLVITVAGYHDKGDNEYDKFDGDAYRLAQIMIGGKYGGPKRPFMRVIHDIFKADDFKRILDNTNVLRKAFFVYMSTPNTPQISYYWEDINSLEKILHDLDSMTNYVKNQYRECGTFESGE